MNDEQNIDIKTEDIKKLDEKTMKDQEKTKINNIQTMDIQKMTLTQKVSLFSLILVTFTTISKFLIYFISGSLTSYSEAWHSLSDVLTTLIVFIAIKISVKKENKKIELIPAIIIATALGYIGLSILYNVIYYKPIKVEYPFWSGIAFIVFSAFSYLLYKIQTITGEKENSIALISDGKHSKTDMLTAILTGVSLILFDQGVDLERFISLILALIIILFSVELFMNTVSVYQKESNILSLKKNINIKKVLFRNKKVKQSLYLFSAISLIFITIWQISYKVPTGSKGIHFRFGKVIKIANSGYHNKIPFIDTIKLKESMKVKSIEIGNIAKGSLIWTNQHGISDLIITGDDNFIVPYVICHYNIKNLSAYYLNHKEPEKLLKDIINEELIFYFSSDSFKNIILNKRGEWSNQIISKVKNRIKNLNLGVNIVDLAIKDIHPPKNVAKSFEELVATMQSQIIVLISAKNYKNLTLNYARVTANRKKIIARISKYEKLEKVKAKKQKDDSLYLVFSKYEKIIKRLKYLNMVASTIENNKKIIVDKSANIDLWLNKPNNIK